MLQMFSSSMSNTGGLGGEKQGGTAMAEKKHMLPSRHGHAAPPAPLPHPRSLLGVLVVHDGQELVHRQHLGEGLGGQQLLRPTARDGIGQRPVRVPGHHQVSHALHGRLVLRVHLLPPQVAAGRPASCESWPRGPPPRVPPAPAPT